MAGLDLSEDRYKTIKEKEYAKYCKKAMRVAIDQYNVKGDDERDFLKNLEDIINRSCNDFEIEYDSQGLPFERQRIYLEVKYHYKEFADTVVSRRIIALRNPDAKILLRGCDFTNKSHLKKYIDVLWDKYQYPWPKDWLQKDGM